MKHFMKYFVKHLMKLVKRVKNLAAYRPNCRPNCKPNDGQRVSWWRRGAWLVAVMLGIVVGCGGGSLGGSLGGGDRLAIALPSMPQQVTSSAPVFLAQPPADRLPLDQAADAAERASDQIYTGIEATKRKIGKTKGRKEAIQTARDRASNKWQSLAEKARAAQQNSSIELSPVERQNLKRLNESQP